MFAGEQLRALLSELERTDTFFVFAEPVNPAEVRKSWSCLFAILRMRSSRRPRTHMRVWTCACAPQVPDYLDIIQRPMDFSTMKRRLEDGVYDADYGALEADFSQIINNCMIYNAHGACGPAHHERTRPLWPAVTQTVAGVFTRRPGTVAQGRTFTSRRSTCARSAAASCHGSASGTRTLPAKSPPAATAAATTTVSKPVAAAAPVRRYVTDAPAMVRDIAMRN